MYTPFDFNLDEQQEARAKQLHDSAIIVDGLGGSILGRPVPDVDGVDRIDQYRNNGVTVSNETIAMPWDKSRDTMRRFFDYYCLDEISEGRTIEILTVEDIKTAFDNGKLGILYGLQSADAFEDDSSLIPIFHRLGLRIANLVYNGKNFIGSGGQEANDDGLTSFGQSVVVEMNRVGITLDLSHTGIKTSLDAIDVSSKPVVFSHSNARQLTDHIRNLTDEQIKATAETGGLIGLCPHSQFSEKERRVRPDLNDFLDHLDYVAEMVGIDHVGIGTDLFGGKTIGEAVFRFQLGRQSRGAWGGYDIDSKYVSGFDNVYGWLNVTRGLVSRGLSDEEVHKVLGGNWMRVFSETWKA